jgi:hypothetical protein
LQPNWQLFGEMSIFNEDFEALMPSLSLTLNPEPLNPERLNPNRIDSQVNPICQVIFNLTRPQIMGQYFERKASFAVSPIG